MEVFVCISKKMYQLRKNHANISSIIHNNIYVSNFQQKANIFNYYFADQCNILDNGSILPEYISKTIASIPHINITTEQIVDIILRSIPLTKHIVVTTCQSLCYNYVPLKYAKVLHIHKKGNHQIISNDRPISLLPICGNILEKIMIPLI